MNDAKVRGFTLVELSIVLTIIGLLIGGILKGQELIKAAEVTSTIAQVNAYRAATDTFLDQYDAMPGDMATATTRIQGCTVANSCSNGDGDNIVGVVSVTAADIDQTGTTLPNIETSLFWKHLALGDYISGVDLGANIAVPASGVTHPAAKIRGTFSVATKTDVTGTPDSFPSGLLLILSSSPNLSSPAILPREAVQLDKKMDDGLPNAGFVAAEPLATNCKTSDLPDGLYNETVLTRACFLYFRMK